MFSGSLLVHSFKKNVMCGTLNVLGTLRVTGDIERLTRQIQIAVLKLVSLRDRSAKQLSCNVMSAVEGERSLGNYIGGTPNLYRRVREGLRGDDI